MSPLRIDFCAIGTTATVVVQRPTDLVGARRALERELERIDLACSRFRPDSELARVHRAAGGPTRIGEALAEAVSVALWAAEVTGGLVDPTVGSALVDLGYDRDFALLAPPARGGAKGADHRAAPAGLPGPAGTPRRAERARPVRGWRCVALDRTRGTLVVPEGVLLDLGATAKALAVDRAARHVAATCTGGVLVSVGGDMALAGPAPRGGWAVRIAERHDADADVGGPCVALRDGGLATSSTTVRRWSQSGRCRHHIVDPATGSPAPEVWRAVSVAAASCVHANTASTAALLLGGRAPNWLAGLGLPARLVAADGAVTTVARWPAESESPGAGGPRTPMGPGSAA